SRHDPDGVLLDLVGSGALQVLDPRALAFTADEAAALLTDRLDENTARALQERTDGWIAGMLMLAHTSGVGPSNTGSGTEQIASYFQDRVLASFDAGTLRTLAAVSLLPEVDGDV